MSIRTIRNAEGILEVIDDSSIESSGKRAEREKNSAKCGQVKRRLLRNEPLVGELLEFALSVVGDGSDTGSKELSSMADKLKTGKQLSEYELHIMIDVLLLHIRLS